MKQPDPDKALAPRPARTRTPGMAAALGQQSDREADLVHLTVQVPEETRRRIKMAAARDGVSVREVVLAGIEAELARRE